MPPPPTTPVNVEQVQRDLQKIEDAASAAVGRIWPEAHSSVDTGPRSAKIRALFQLLGGALRPYGERMAALSMCWWWRRSSSIRRRICCNRPSTAPLPMLQRHRLVADCRLLWFYRHCHLWIDLRLHPFFAQQAGRRRWPICACVFLATCSTTIMPFCRKRRPADWWQLTNDIDQLNAVLSNSVVVVLGRQPLFSPSSA
ncbi:MAG: hypothetical protein R2911_44690 [Caldilineaceae bacterium]